MCDDGGVNEIDSVNMPAYLPLNDLRKSMPKICKMLGVKNQDELSVLQFTSVPKNYMDSKSIRDKSIECLGVPGMPWIAERGLHNWKGGPPGIGIIHYRCRFIENINYVVFSTVYSNGWDWKCYVLPKGKAASFVYYARKMETLYHKKNPPILKDGLLDIITNNTIGFLSRKKELKKYNVNICRGIILMGSPGNGKTMTCRWIQRECLENSIDYAVVSGAVMMKTFNDGHPLDVYFSGQTVTFFDDIDVSFLIDRSSPSSNTKMACAMLSAMDGMKQADHSIRIFTTNEDISDIDKAFLRPGRIDRCFNFEPPSADLRRKLVEERWPEEILSYLKKEDLIQQLISKTDKFSFSELESIRTILVTNKLINQSDWSLDGAFEEYHRIKSGVTDLKCKVGFEDIKLAS